MIALLLATAVLLPDGSPAAGAAAASLAKEHFVHVAGTGFARPVEPVLIGEDGRLDVTPETAGRWVILHEQGYADTTLAPDTAEVRLEPWCEITGSVAAPHAPDALVTYHRTERPRRTNDRGSVFWTSSATVREDSTFVLTHVPRGHSSVGLQREAKNERRIQRWRDYVRSFDVPSPGPSILAGGTTVSGRIVADHLPAILTLASKGPEPSAHGLTDSEGRFEIPGVLPGEYRFSARPDLGSATINIPHRDITVGKDPLDLGDLSGTEPDVEIDRRVDFSDSLTGRIREEAAKHSAATIDKIWIGELVHPTGLYGARVSFAPRLDPSDPTRATQTDLLINIPGEPIRKFYPEHDSLGWGFRFESGPFENARTVERKLRVFPLKQSTLHLPIEEGVEYADALALLRAVESNAVLRTEPAKGTHPDGTSWVKVRVVGDIEPGDLPTITAVQKGQSDGEIQLNSRTRPFGGRNYQFKKTSEGFLLTGVSNWVS